MYANIREQWRRSLAEAGLTLVDGSFEEGATVNSKTDAVWYIAGGQCYTWDGSLSKTVAPRATPESTGGIGAGAWVSTAIVSLRGALLTEDSQLLVDDSRVKIKQPFLGAIARSQHVKNREEASVMDCGAIGDGALHPLSEFYSSLADAQAVYPFVTSLSQSIDYAAIQSAINSGSHWTVAPRDKRRSFCLTDTLRISRNNSSLDLNGSELKIVDPTGLKSHILIQSDDNTQIQGNYLRNVTLVNEHPSTVYQVKTVFTGGLWVDHCIGWSPSYGHTYGFIDLGNAIICNIINCVTEGMKDSSVNMHGTGLDANRTVDVCMYDNRFVDGDYGIKAGNYTEGVFARRNIIYAQRVATVGLIPDSKATAIGSIKLQEIDFDSPNLTGYFLYARYVKNVQVTGSWFSGTLAAPMIKLEETDSVLIEGNQAYPKDAFVADNGIGTTIVGNMVVGGTVAVQFGAKADRTLVASNNIRGVIVAVDAGTHPNALSVKSNHFEASSSGISWTSNSKHVIEGNTGDNVRGVTTSSYVGNSPYVSYTGPRPESISFRKASGIMSIVVNDVEIYNSVDGTPTPFIGIGTLPPHTKFSVVFNPANSPWLNIVKC